MKIYIDINHPAHVHYFRGFIKIMEQKGHRFCVVNRDSMMINQLLDFYGIKHHIRNKRPHRSGTIISAISFMKTIGWSFVMSFRFRPDIYLGFASASCAIAAWFFRKPSVLLDDTEHNRMNHRLIRPFASTILTPFYYWLDLKIKKNGYDRQITFHAFVEQLYLHSSCFKRNMCVLDELNLKSKEYVLVRYIAYNAYHDVNVRPLSDDAKKRIVLELSKHYKVLVSLEEETDDIFYEKYIVRISPEKMHDLEASAKFMITEGATMASESFMHGVPYIFINPLKYGYIDWQCQNYPNMAFKTTDEDEIFNIINKIIAYDNNFIDKIREEVESKTIIPTYFLVWFVDKYPESRDIMSENPDYQWKFSQ